MEVRWTFSALGSSWYDQSTRCSLDAPFPLPLSALFSHSPVTHTHSIDACGSGSWPRDRLRGMNSGSKSRTRSSLSDSTQPFRLAAAPPSQPPSKWTTRRMFYACEGVGRGTPWTDHHLRAWSLTLLGACGVLAPWQLSIPSLTRNRLRAGRSSNQSTKVSPSRAMHACSRDQSMMASETGWYAIHAVRWDSHAMLVCRMYNLRITVRSHRSSRVAAVVYFDVICL
jgi:hypothetical protein